MRVSKFQADKPEAFWPRTRDASAVETAMAVPKYSQGKLLEYLANSQKLLEEYAANLRKMRSKTAKKKGPAKAGPSRNGELYSTYWNSDRIEDGRWLAIDSAWVPSC